MARYCACGCVLGVFKNTTVYFKADECARNGSHALWILRPVFHNASSIIVRLSSARLGEPDSNYLVVRDGVNAGGDMLVTLTGGDESSRLPLELRSPSGPLRIEFVYGTAAPGKDVDVLMSFYEELIPRGVTALAQIGLLHRIRQLPQLHLVALIVVGSLLIVSGTLCLVHRVALAKVITKQRRPSVFSIPPGNVEGQVVTLRTLLTNTRCKGLELLKLGGKCLGDSYLTAVKWNDLTRDRVLEFGFGHLKKKIRTKQFFSTWCVHNSFVEIDVP